MFCKKCGTQLDADVRFCKKCGTPTDAAGVETAYRMAEPLYSTPPPLPYATMPPPPPPAFTSPPAFPPPSEISPPAFSPSPEMSSSPVFSPPPPMSPPQVFSPSPAMSQPPTPSRQAALNQRALWIGLGVVALLLLAGGYYWYSRAGLERNIEAAVAIGNLLKPAGESAFDYYRQLKQKGMSESVRKQLSDKITPRLTARPRQMLADLMTPGNPSEATLAEWQDAQTLTGWAAEVQPGDQAIAARASYCAGRAAFLSNRKDEALTFWKRASEQDATWALPLNGLGLIYNERKNYQTARSFLFEAIRREPRFALPYNNIGTSYLSEKNDVQAEGYYRKAAELAPQWARPHAWLADIAMRRKDYNRAAAEFESVLNLDPSGTSGIDPNRIRQQLEQARQQSQQGASTVANEIRLTAENTEARVWLHPDRWSEKVVPPPRHNFSFNGTSGAMVQFTDGTEGSVTRNYGNNNEWAKGFRFKGPEGGWVVVKVTPQR